MPFDGRKSLLREWRKGAPVKVDPTWFLVLIQLADFIRKFFRDDTDG